VGESSRDSQNVQSGRLRTYLGTAPGVGKTYAMLNDGWQRSEGGERVVVGWIEHHDRAETGAQLRNLEIVPPRSVAYRGRTFGELDVVLASQGVGPLAARPTVVAGVSGSAWGENVIRRAALLAAEDDAELLVVHVNVADGLSRRRADTLGRYRDMTLEAGGRYTRSMARARPRPWRRRRGTYMPPASSSPATGPDSAGSFAAQSCHKSAASSQASQCTKCGDPSRFAGVNVDHDIDEAME
jgi:K+-sensing histidine kinase KdpD